MIKIRSHKKIALLLVLAMLATMFVGVGTASASSDYLTVNGSYKYVDADDNVTAGTITVVKGDDYATIPTFETIYAEVTLPDGVTLHTGGDDSFTVNADYDTDLSTTLTALNNNIAAKLTKLDIDGDFTGSVTASVEVWGVDSGDNTVFDITDNATIDKISSGDVTVTAKSAKTVSVGDSKTGAKITIKEDSPGALTANGTITLTIKNSKVSWDNTTVATADPTDLIDSTTITGDNDQNLKIYVGTATTAYKGSVYITPKLKVEPGATGDVDVKVSGTDVDSTDVTVATIGDSSLDVSVDKADKDTVYQGQIATFDDVDITLSPSNDLNDDDYITMTLPDGLKWYNADDWATSDDPAQIDGNYAEYNGLYNDDQSMWISLTNGGSDDDIDITYPKIVADADATVGDLNITFGGSVSGTYKVGTVAAPFIVTADPVNIATNASDVTGGKITITEADDGALIETDEDSDNDKTDEVPSYLDITLPMGVTFADTPTVKVTDGDLDIDSPELNDDSDILYIPIAGTSSVASTIEITNVKYNVDNRAATGEITAKMGKAYNLESSSALATVKLGTIGTVSGASFVIGSSTYTRADGTTVDCVAPSYAANNRTYLAIRDIAHVLGIDDSNILWDGTTSTVTLMKGDKVVQLKVNSNILTVNGVNVTMDVAVQASNDRTFLPAAFVAQAFGATATWDAATNAVTIK